jgi:TIR domain
MFVSVAAQLTPEAEDELIRLEESGAFGDRNVDFIRQLLQRHQARTGPTEVEIARQADLSVRTVRRLAPAAIGPPSTRSPRKHASVFLSYGGPDEAFTRKLYEALREENIEVFFFPESATPGERLHRTMSEAIHEYDRILLVCSKSSLGRRGVLNELEQVLAREAREGGTELLMPVLLDDFALVEWAPPRADMARQVRDRVAADFRKDSSPSEFTKQLKRVLRALEVAL